MVSFRARAQQTAPPKGIPAGPWVLAPSLVIGYQYDTNVFQQDESQAPLDDYSLVFEPGITATLPFRNSFVDFSYKATRENYGTAFPDAQLSQQAGSNLHLLFSSMNQLVLAGSWSGGVAKVEAFDPGGEVVYRGDSYNLHDYSAELSKNAGGRRGYSLLGKYTSFHFDADALSTFFDYEGYSADAEYREPLGPSIWAVAAYSGSWFDHFCRVLDPFGNPCPPGDEPFRRETSDTASVGMRGTLGKTEGFLFRVGGSRYHYSPQTSQDFTGLTLEGNLGLPLGAATSLRLGALRRPYPSFYLNNDYYVVERIDTALDHHERNDTTFGARLSYWTSDYPNRIAAPGQPEDGEMRLDHHLQAEAYANLLLVRRFGISLSVSYQTRDSSVEGLDFRGTVFFAGVSYGYP